MPCNGASETVLRKMLGRARKIAIGYGRRARAKGKLMERREIEREGTGEPREAFVREYVWKMVEEGVRRRRSGRADSAEQMKRD